MAAKTGRVKVKRKAKTITPANNPHQELHLQEIDNPLYNRAHDGDNTNPRKITAMLNLRESPIAMMAKKGHLKEHHVKAAIEFRRLFEALGGAGAGSFDYSREPVDGGGAREPITDRQVYAGQRLAQCERYLGKRPYAIVSKVAGEGVSVAALGTSHRERTTIADYLRHALDDLAELWGMKTRTRRVNGL